MNKYDWLMTGLLALAVALAMVLVFGVLTMDAVRAIRDKRKRRKQI